MFSKAKKQERARTRIEKRVESLPSAELLPWSEQAIYAVGRNLSTWQKNQDPFYLEEARVAAEALHTITEALSRRHTDVKF
jgi:hypothetical protein